VIFVVDASVAIKWFIRETLHQEALRLLDSPDALHAPDLLAAEVTNNAWKKARIGEIGEGQAMDIARTIRHGTPILYPSALFNERALELAFLLDHPAYDCFYLACAEIVGGPLITADAKFHRTAQKAGFADRVRPLGL
jgi:predicted nucleic acid-binding protein